MPEIGRNKYFLATARHSMPVGVADHLKIKAGHPYDTGDVAAKRQVRPLTGSSSTAYTKKQDALGN